MFKIKEGNSKILLIDLDKTKLNKKNKICNEQPSHKQLLLDLLFHKHLFNNREPTIVTEGKTDYVYLKLAIHALHSKIDLNGLIDSATKKLKFSFLKHEKAGTEAILGSGGTGHLTKLIHYIRRMESR